MIEIHLRSQINGAVTIDPVGRRQPRLVSRVYGPVTRNSAVGTR
jgi:hypothetical protein